MDLTQPGAPGGLAGSLGRGARRFGPHAPVAALIGIYFGWFSLLSVRIYDAYGSPGFDMGIFDQGVWLLSRFHAPFVTVMGRDLFGDHTSFIVLLAVPLYWLHPAPQTLLVLQSGLLAVAAVPIYLLARRWTSSTALATGLAAAYLLDPALQEGNLEQFHPECFLALAIAVAIYAAVEWRPALLAASSIGCLLVKEDSALLVVALGAWVYLRRDTRWGTGLMTGALAYMLFAYGVVIQALLGTTSFYTGRLPFGGFWGLLSSPFTQPGRLLRYLGADNRPWYLWQMGAAFGWAFLAAPEVAAVGVLTFAENVVSAFPYMHRIYYHYSLPLVPVLAAGTAVAVGRLGNRRRRRAGAVWVCAAALVSCLTWGPPPVWNPPVGPVGPASGPAVRALDRLVRRVPPAASVSAYWPVVAHLTHRTDVYQWPTPFRATLWGLYTQEGQRLPAAGRVEYLVIPSRRTGVDATVFDSIAARFRPVASGGGYTLYRSTGTRASPALRLGRRYGGTAPRRPPA